MVLLVHSFQSSPVTYTSPGDVNQYLWPDRTCTCDPFVTTDGEESTHRDPFSNSYQRVDLLQNTSKDIEPKNAGLEVKNTDGMRTILHDNVKCYSVVVISM